MGDVQAALAQQQLQPAAAAADPAAAPGAQPPAAGEAQPSSKQRKRKQKDKDGDMAAALSAERPPGKCHYFLEHKRRFCKFDAVPGKRFCGNHMFLGEGTGPRRVPCPWDPKGGHTVLESELEKHKFKCPGYLQQQARRAQPFFAEDINAGPADAAVAWPEGLAPATGGGAAADAEREAAVAAAAADEGSDGGEDSEGEDGAETAAGSEGGGAGSEGRRRRRRRGPQGAAVMQAAYAASLSQHQFDDLLRRVEAACKQICEDEPLHVVVPPAAEPLLQPDSATQNRPFSLKHAQQQASIVGNMQTHGLLDRAEDTTYVEYGAGKGYLSQLLCACTGARKVVMMDVRGFKAKADRGMRHLDMQRLRCDIKDFEVAGVPGLGGGAAPWVAFGKHLCGAATDFTLRSCARELRRQQGQQEPGQQRTGQPGQLGGQQAGSPPPAEPAGGAAAAPGGTAGAGSGLVAAGSGVRGLAVATCCHHRCCWQHFVAQEEVAALGFTPLEFEVIAWMTGWALCGGHEAPADYASDAEEGDSPQQDAQQAQQGGAVPPPGGAPPDALPRARKVAVGRACKRLIDAARMHWLRRQGFSAALLKYVPSSVSGENRLLVATVPAAWSAGGVAAAPAP